MQIEDPRKTVIAIDKASVHKICSGQVIVSLSVAVKELVENSIDAGSALIDVRLKQYGSTLIEIVDNGSGIHGDDLESLALKHHTSKLTTFNNLESIETYGFRGEALSSLCALSDVEVVTRHSSSDVGTAIKFDHNGQIKEKISRARLVGTTVTVKDIFKCLPVRHKEFLKNLKHEFNKMLQMLYAYCIISKNIRITCSHQLNNEKKILVATHGNDCVMKNLHDVFGSKCVEKLLEFVQCEPSEDVLNEFNVKNYPSEIDARFEGFVSSCQHGSGRNQCDKQFYYINGRPCDAPKFVKLVNETYHTFNKDQYPLIVLNLIYDRKAVDINVTPDKRKIFLNEEKFLLAILKTSLLTMFEKNCVVFMPPNESSGETRDIRLPEIQKVSKNSLKQLFSMKSFEANEDTPCKKQRIIKTFFKPEKGIDSKGSKGTTPKKRVDNVPEITQTENKSELILIEPIPKSSNDELLIENKLETHHEQLIQSRPRREITLEFDQNIIQNKRNRLEEIDYIEIDNEKFDGDYRAKRKTITISFSLALLQKNTYKLNSIESLNNSDRLFTAKINPDDNSTAESELKRQLDKSNFKQMEIIGQFNLGFVVVKLGSDLFIVDQHASDEKFNYEMLEKGIELKGQPLIRPQHLFLTAVEENIITDNLTTFEKNGFKFDFVAEDCPIGQRVKLVAVPYSQNVVFDKSDVEELIYFLSDSPGVLFRPTRVQKMLAMRACRKSIMIGTALNRYEMKRLVGHMSDLDQPWNCPHGRPTIRHLISLNRI